MTAKGNVQALLFDVFGTVVDWRGSIIADLTRFGAEKGLKADWAAFTDDWRGLYQPAMEEVRSGRRAWTILDVLHRESLDVLLAKYAITGLERGRQGSHQPRLASPEALARHRRGTEASQDALHHRHAVERQRRAADAHGQERRPALGRRAGRGDRARLQAAARRLPGRRRAAQSRARAGHAGGGPQRRPRRRGQPPACAPPSWRDPPSTARTRRSTSRPKATGTWSPTASPALPTPWAADAGHRCLPRPELVEGRATDRNRGSTGSPLRLHANDYRRRKWRNDGPDTTLTDLIVRQHHTAVSCRDWDAMKSFFVDLLGFKVLGEMENRDEAAAGHRHRHARRRLPLGHAGTRRLPHRAVQVAHARGQADPDPPVRPRPHPHLLPGEGRRRKCTAA